MITTSMPTSGFHPITLDQLIDYHNDIVASINISAHFSFIRIVVLRRVAKTNTGDSYTYVHHRVLCPYKPHRKQIRTFILKRGCPDAIIMLHTQDPRSNSGVEVDPPLPSRAFTPTGTTPTRIDWNVHCNHVRDTLSTRGRITVGLWKGVFTHAELKAMKALDHDELVRRQVIIDEENHILSNKKNSDGDVMTDEEYKKCKIRFGNDQYNELFKNNGKWNKATAIVRPSERRRVRTLSFRDREIQKQHFLAPTTSRSILRTLQRINGGVTAAAS